MNIYNTIVNSTELWFSLYFYWIVHLFLDKMSKLCVEVIFIVILLLDIDFVFPQLDIPSNMPNYTRILTATGSQKSFRTNGHSDKTFSDTGISREQSNEFGSDDVLNYDKDRSSRYGPPYTEENYRRFYTNNENDNSRYFDRNPERANGDIDEDDKYHSQPRSPYYISEKQRNRNGYQDYHFTLRENVHNNQYNSYDGRNSYDNPNPYGTGYPNDDERMRPNNYSDYNSEDYSDRNRFSSRDYEQYRIDLERMNRIEDANLRRILDDVDKLSSSECFHNVAAQWNFETNVNEATQQESVSFDHGKNFIKIYCR